MRPKPHTAVLIFDGSCPLCTRAAEWAERNARPGALETAACQSDERAAWFPDMPEAACMTAMQLVTADGARYSGEEALPHLLRLMKRWRWLALVLRAPGVRHLSPAFYAWVARHRHTLAVIVARKVR